MACDLVTCERCRYHIAKSGVRRWCWFICGGSMKVFLRRRGLGTETGNSEKQGERAAQTSEEEAQQHMQKSCLRQESLTCL